MSGNNNNAPRLRFPGFTGEWEERRLGEVFSNHEERNTDCSIGYDKTISVATMVYNQSGNGAAEDSLRTYKVLRIGDIAFEGNRSKNYSYGRFVMDDIGEGVMSPRFKALRPKSPLIVDFWKRLINYEPIMRSRLVNATKMGTMMNELIVPEILRQTVPVPPLAEQRKIAACLTAMDDLIAAQARKVEALRGRKRGLMQQLFPQKGEGAPRLRFPGFTGEWEENPLSAFLFEHKTKSDGKCEVHSVSVAKGVINQVEYLGRSFAAADTSKYNLVKPNDIIYTKSPTGNFPYGIVRMNKKTYNVIVSPLYAVYSPVNKNIGYILDSYFESPSNTNNYLSTLVQKGAKNTIQISNDAFVSKSMRLPTDEYEQRKIAACLTAMDDLIAAQARNVEALRERKRGLMQQLFPQ